MDTAHVHVSCRDCVLFVSFSVSAELTKFNIFPRIETMKCITVSTCTIVHVYIHMYMLYNNIGIFVKKLLLELFM